MKDNFTFEDAVYCAQQYNGTLTDVDLSKHSVLAHCPKSNHKTSKKIKIDFANGWFNCAKCNSGGSSPVSLFMHVTDITDGTKAARTMHLILGDDLQGVNRPEEIQKEKAPEEFPVANIEVRHKTYQSMLDILTLSANHKEQLIQSRGLTEEDVIRLGYKSIPRNAKIVCKELLQKGCILEGVPGFYMDKKGKWTINVYGTGIFVPFRNAFEQIQFMQIRTDTPKEDGQRYFALSSSGKNYGTPARTWIHIRQGYEGLKEIFITEGALKADVASALSGKTFLAVAGVNNIGDLPRALRDLTIQGFKKAVLCYDMDKKENIQVLEAEAKLKEMLTLLEIPFEVLEWEGEKGIDDWLYSNKNNN